MSETSSRDIEVSFYEELQLLPFVERCIVLGIVMGVDENEIRGSLRMEAEEFNEIVARGRLKRWNLFRALLDN